jgi:hypothetical protein
MATDYKEANIIEKLLQNLRKISKKQINIKIKLYIYHI